MHRNAEADAYAQLLHEIRSTLILSMDEVGLSRAALANKLGVSRSVISRVLDPTSDVLVSTLFDLAWAIRKTWVFSLQPVETDGTTSVNFQYDSVMVGDSDAFEDVIDEYPFVASFFLESIDR